MKTFKNMKSRVECYLAYRRALGYHLKIEGSELLRFAAYAQNQGHTGPLTEALVIAWACSSKKATRRGWARRLETLRSFARYCAIYEPQTPLLREPIFGSGHARKTPYIYSQDEIQQLLKATAELSPTDGLRPVSFYYVFALLYSTGLRVSEALKLTVDDVDLERCVMCIRETKFRKTRLVPIDRTTADALTRYLEHRRPYAKASCAAFFILDNGEAINYRAIHYVFLRLRQRLGWDTKIQGRYRRLYDLRHTFVCHRLLAWYEAGLDVFELLPQLSIYLGHVKVSDTYWYITGIPALMALAGKRFEDYIDTNTGE